MHRLFAALPVPDSIAERLLPLRTDIYGARWRRREHFHITLQFFGKVNAEVAHEIAEALTLISSPQMSLELNGVGWFGRKEPRALYARVKEDEALTALAADCRKIARKFKLDLSQDPFLPHIIVMRRRLKMPCVGAKIIKSSVASRLCWTNSIFTKVSQATKSKASMCLKLTIG
jgi:2'-5' RNA ligase